MTAPPSVSLNDLLFAFYKAGSPAADNNLAVTMGQGIVTSNTQFSNQYQTASASGTATAPAANGAVATLAIAGAGYYKVLVSAGFGGTAEATALDNMKVENAGTVIGPISLQNVANWISPAYEFWIKMAGAGNITVNAIAAASAGAIYKSTIIVTRVM